MEFEFSDISLFVSLAIAFGEALFYLSMPIIHYLHSKL